MLKRIGYVLVAVAFCLCIAAFATQQVNFCIRSLLILTMSPQQLADGRLKLDKMEQIVEGQKKFVEDSKGVLAAKERTLQWRSDVIQEKTEKIHTLDTLASDEVDALAAKDRTLQWKAQVIAENQARIKKLESKVQKERTELFELHKLHALGSKVAHTKLVKMMTVVQSYLTRQKKTGEILRVTNRNMNAQMAKYTKTIDSLAQEMNWQPHVKKRLQDHSYDLANNMKSLMSFSSNEIINENRGAEKRYV
jgi:hypothetical protein